MNKKQKKYFFTFFQCLSSQEKELLIKRLAYLLKAGVPILQSLTMLLEQTRSKFQKQIIQSLIEDVSNGQPIYVGLGKFKKVFGTFIINVIRVGENTGFLHQNLEYLAEELKKQRLLKKKIIGALVYPAFIAITTVIITTCLIIFIFPKILPILTSLNAPLPITTKVIISLSNFLRHQGLKLLLGIVIFIIFLRFLAKIPRVKYFLDRIQLSFPIIGRLMQNYHLANLCRTLGVLLMGNVKLLESIKIAAETSTNTIYSKMLEKIEKNVARGKKISGQFGNYPRYFPILIPQMLSVGEATGNLSGSLVYIAEFYESEVDEMTKNLSAVLEPILMIIMGIVVGFVVLSIITPIYGITQYIKIR